VSSPVLPTWYVIAVRIARGEHYRTRYFSECHDGKPRVGAKIEGARFGETEAGQVCAQLNTLAPLLRFVVCDDSKPPPREAWAGWTPPYRQAEQSRIDDIEGDAGVPAP